MFCGELETMASRVANHATEVYGGKAVDKHFHADYAVVGRDPYEHVGYPTPDSLHVVDAPMRPSLCAWHPA